MITNEKSYQFSTSVMCLYNITGRELYTTKAFNAFYISKLYMKIKPSHCPFKFETTGAPRELWYSIPEEKI